MKTISIIYGSTTDNTKNAATLIAGQLHDLSPQLKDVAQCRRYMSRLSADKKALQK